jgi:hypothetical protein
VWFSVGAETVQQREGAEVTTEWRPVVLAMKNSAVLTTSRDRNGIVDQLP